MLIMQMELMSVGFGMVIMPDMDIPKTGGDRHEDMALRLKVAGIPEEKLLEIPDLEQVISEIKTLPTDHVYILATYTAVLQLRKSLTAQGYIQGE